jgi:hypothetical protein
MADKVTGFDRFPSDSPDVKAETEAAFAAALATSTAFQATLQTEDAQWMNGSAAGNIGDVNSTIVEP